MSCVRKVNTFKEVKTIVIECCNKKELLDLENSIKLSIQQKLEKLNILIRNCDVYAYGGRLLVNDRYNICPDLMSVAEAFGLLIKQVDCSLKGKTYVISDELVHALKQLGTNLEYGNNVANKETDSIVQSIIEKLQINEQLNQDVLEMVNNIMENGVYKTTTSRDVIESIDVEGSRSRLVERVEGSWDKNPNEIRKDLMSILNKAKDTVNQANNQLRDGTTKLIYARARQMGYAVQEVKKDQQVQLVLVRY